MHRGTPERDSLCDPDGDVFRPDTPCAGFRFPPDAYWSSGERLSASLDHFLRYFERHHHWPFHSLGGPSARHPSRTPWPHGAFHHGGQWSTGDGFWTPGKEEIPVLWDCRSLPWGFGEVPHPLSSGSVPRCRSSPCCPGHAGPATCYCSPWRGHCSGSFPGC